MNLAARRIVWAVLTPVLLFSPVLVPAQNPNTISIQTSPPGALVTLTGEVKISGVTPFLFDRPLTGVYRVTAFRKGFETYRITARLAESEPTRLEFRLTPKTRLKAALRSVVFPGWGQKYYGRPGRGVLMFLGAIASSGGYLLIREDFQSKENDLAIAKRNYSRASSWAELVRTDAVLRDAQDQANKAEDRLNIAMGIAVGVYALNVLDCLLFFPNYDGDGNQKLTIRPEFDGAMAGLSVAKQF